MHMHVHGAPCTMHRAPCHVHHARAHAHATCTCTYHMRMHMPRAVHRPSTCHARATRRKLVTRRRRPSRSSCCRRPPRATRSWCSATGSSPAHPSSERPATTPAERRGRPWPAVWACGRRGWVCDAGRWACWMVGVLGGGCVQSGGPLACLPAWRHVTTHAHDGTHACRRAGSVLAVAVCTRVRCAWKVEGGGVLWCEGASGEVSSCRRGPRGTVEERRGESGCL